jgi:hypothetical protein
MFSSVKGILAKLLKKYVLYLELFSKQSTAFKKSCWVIPLILFLLSDCDLHLPILTGG